MRKVTRLLAIAGLVYGGIVAFQGVAYAGGPGSGTCCNIGTDCQGTLICCTPQSQNALACSPAQAGYCYASCIPH